MVKCHQKEFEERDTLRQGIDRNFLNEFRTGTKFVKPISNDDLNFRREFSFSAGHRLAHGNTYLHFFFCISVVFHS